MPSAMESDGKSESKGMNGNDEGKKEWVAAVGGGFLAGLLSVHGAKGGGRASDRGGAVLEFSVWCWRPQQKSFPSLPGKRGFGVWGLGVPPVPQSASTSPSHSHSRVCGAAVDPMNISSNTRAKSACLGGQRLTDEPFSSSSSFCPFGFSPFPLLTLGSYWSASRLSSAIQLSRHTLPPLILLPSIRRPPDSVESPLFRCFFAVSLSSSCLGTCWIWG